jgi:Ca-activated chloride channel family protein
MRARLPLWMGLLAGCLFVLCLQGVVEPRLLAQDPAAPSAASVPATPPLPGPAASAAASVPVRGLRIVTPVAGIPAFGAIEVAVETKGSQPRRMEFWLNGVKAGELSRPPWTLTIDSSEENIERRFRVVAVYDGGERRESEAVLPLIQIDDVIDLPLQQLYITATRAAQSDRPEAPALDLRRESFQVFDMGKRQQIVTFEHGDIPLTAVLLIDSSISMRGDPLRSALAGAHSFAAGMAPLDEAMLLLFSDRVVQHTPWSADPDELLAGLSGSEARGGSAINDHLFLALQLLEKRQGRRVVILLSDGIDVESLLSAAQVDEIATRSQALVYWIRVSSEPFDLLQRSAWRSVPEHSEEIRQLAATVNGSGGRRIDIQRFEDSPRAFQQILTELRQQYVLGYYPQRVKGDGAWHPIKVEVQSKNTVLRTREGYYDD